VPPDQPLRGSDSGPNSDGGPSFFSDRTLELQRLPAAIDSTAVANGLRIGAAPCVGARLLRLPRPPDCGSVYSLLNRMERTRHGCPRKTCGTSCGRWETAQARYAVKQNVVDNIAAQRGLQLTDLALVYQTAFFGPHLGGFWPRSRPEMRDDLDSPAKREGAVCFPGSP
jgi:hypothetical protein